LAADGVDDDDDMMMLCFMELLLLDILGSNGSNANGDCNQPTTTTEPQTISNQKF
jgi:hypothetical protein